MVALGLYIEYNEQARQMCASRNINHWWWAAFNSVSAFNNVGTSKIPLSEGICSSRMLQ